MNGLTVGSLFAGIGGFDLGFERAGMRTVWFAESDPFCQRVLARHWPGVPCYPDVCALVADAGSERLVEGVPSTRDAPTDRGAYSDGEPSRQSSKRIGLPGVLTRKGGAVSADGRVPVPVPHVDVLCGGFPCQDLSYAGKGAGIDGARSGLWSEFARLIGDLRPRYVVIENVPALLSRGGDRVLADLAACGLDAEWDCLPASAFGAPHRRDRVWIVAYPANVRYERTGQTRNGGHGLEDGGGGITVADPDERPDLGREGDRNSWASEPDVGRVAARVPARVDRLRALGNSLVPQIAQFIGERLMSYEAGVAA